MTPPYHTGAVVAVAYSWVQAGRTAIVFFSYALLMILSYYVLNTIREPVPGELLFHH